MKNNFVVKNIETGVYSIKTCPEGSTPEWEGFKTLDGGPYSEVIANTIANQGNDMKAKEEATEGEQSERRSNRDTPFLYGFEIAFEWWDTLTLDKQIEFAQEFSCTPQELTDVNIEWLYGEHCFTCYKKNS